MSDVKVAQPTFGHDHEKLEITHAEHRDVGTDDPSFVEKGGNGQATLDIVYVPGTAEEKALVRKMDRRLLPILWLMYGRSAYSLPIRRRDRHPLLLSQCSTIWTEPTSVYVPIFPRVITG